MVENNVKKVCDYLIADVPFPPSINDLKSLVKIGKGYRIGRSSKYKKYIRETFDPWWLTVRQGGPVRFGPKVMVWAILCPPRANCDIDNYLKCFIDCLEHAGAIEDDKRVVSIRVEKGPRVSGGLMQVFVGNARWSQQLAQDYLDRQQFWNQHDIDGPILKRPDQLALRRAGFAASAQYPAGLAPADIASPF